MIKDHEQVADYIAGWIKGYVSKAGAKGVVLGLSGGIDSALVALFCKRAGVPVHCVNMPCHSSSSAFERASGFAKEFELPLVKIDLSMAHVDMIAQFKIQNVLPTPGAEAALRSCLRAPTLSAFAHTHNALIIGTGNRSEDNITRYFQKFGDGCVDFSPIADLFKSEVYDLFQFLATDGNKQSAPPGAAAIYNAKPSADLWGPESGQEDEKELGLTYDEVEWGDRENDRTRDQYLALNDARYKHGIVFNDRNPSDWPSFATYTFRQQQVITTLHKMEKVSRHKMNPNQPVCKVRHLSAID